VLTPETVQGGQDAVPDFGCKMPPSRLVLPPWFPNWPLTNRASWCGAACSSGYEFAGHGWPEQRGTALALESGCWQSTQRRIFLLQLTQRRIFPLTTDPPYESGNGVLGVEARHGALTLGWSLLNQPFLGETERTIPRSRPGVQNRRARRAGQRRRAGPEPRAAKRAWRGPTL